MELFLIFWVKVEVVKDLLLMVVCLAIVGNVIDMGVDGSLIEVDVCEVLE